MNYRKIKPIYIVIGTRAQLIKMAPVIKEFDKRKIKYKFIYTSQHKETIDQILIDFAIRKPDYILKTKTEAKTIKLFSKWILASLIAVIFNRKKIISEKGMVIIHGDTISCLWGAILGKLSKCQILHIESGLRSYNIFNPFPEELIRVIVFKLANFYACPNNWALKNLEKYKGDKLNTEINTLYDSVNLALNNENILSCKFRAPVEYAVVSIHRFENIFNKNKLMRIQNVINNISERIKLVFVLHPSTKKQLNKYNMNKLFNKNIMLTDRLSYRDFIVLLKSSEFVITDGGSNQEELSYLGIPTLILRNATERMEGLNKNAVLSNFNLLTITDFLNNYQKFKTNKLKVNKSPSKMIVDWIELKYLSQ